MVKQQDIAEIKIWNKSVGALYWDRDRELGVFEYRPDFIKEELELSPIHMPLKAGTTYTFPALSKDTYKGLPALLADALPDAFGNSVIDAWLAREGRSASDFSPVERLLYTGTRAMGALEFHPAGVSLNNQSESIELESLVALAQEVLDQRKSLSEPFSKSSALNKEALTQLLHVGTSAGGARPKAVVAINKDRTEIRSGQISHHEEFEYWLLKFDGVSEHSTKSELFGDPLGFGIMEYAYYLMATEAGVTMMPCELLKDGKRAHFITKRFDRAQGQKLHMQTLCAIAHADYMKPGHFSYEELFAVLRQLRLSRAEAIELYRRMVFNVIARNQDDHTKNTSFLMNSQGEWRLAPAYDIAWSYKPDSPWVSVHQMSLNGKRDNFSREDLLAVASLISNFKKEAVQIIEQTKEVVAQWDSYANRAGVFPELQKQIKSTLRLEI